MVIVGIDPGVQPTLALLDGTRVEFFDETAVKVKRGKTIKREPEARLITRILKQWTPDLVIIEQVTMRPGEGASGGGSFMRARGILEGVCAGLGLSYQLVAPVTWTRQMRVPKGDGGSRRRALELMPDLIEDLARKKDHNRADALLIALWGKQFAAPAHPLF